MPVDKIDIPVNAKAQDKLPNLSFLLTTNKTINVKLPSQEPVAFRDKDLITNPYDQVYNSTIKYTGNTGDLGLYIEVGENLDSSLSEEISEITATVYPDLLVDKFDNSDIPIISTSNGKTFMHIPKLNTDKLYRVDLLREKILKMEVSKSVPSNIQIRAKLYTLDKLADLVHAKVVIDGKLLSIPVYPWMPACMEAILDDELLYNAIHNVLRSGIQFEEILVLNENLGRINSGTIKLKDMKDSDATIMISASPYSTQIEGVLDEFMMTSVAKGKEKTVMRSQGFEESIYMAQIDLSKSKHDIVGFRINYALAENSPETNFDSAFSK